MKKVTSIVVVVVALLVVMTGMALASNIANTRHNLRSNVSNTNPIKGDVDEICIYCHTPHGGNQAVAPLWNRSGVTAAGSFQMYATSGTFTQIAGALGSSSLACLSCHDGATSVNNLTNVLGAAHDPANTGTKIAVASLAYIGTDLRNDHPVGVVLAGSGDTEIKSSPSSTFVRVFTGGRMECASCHQVHDNTYAPFLVMSNAGSAICLACHIK